MLCHIIWNELIFFWLHVWYGLNHVGHECWEIKLDSTLLLLRKIVLRKNPKIWTFSLFFQVAVHYKFILSCHFIQKDFQKNNCKMTKL